MTDITAADILDQASKLVDGEDKWTRWLRGASRPMRDEDMKSSDNIYYGDLAVPVERATTFCLMGAVQRALYDVGISKNTVGSSEYLKARAPITDVLQLMVEETTGTRMYITGWNDTVCQDHNEAAAFLREAASLARAREFKNE